MPLVDGVVSVGDSLLSSGVKAPVMKASLNELMSAGVVGVVSPSLPSGSLKRCDLLLNTPAQ